MPWLVTGTCSRCGKCCRVEGGFVSDNPCLPRGEDRCRFYTEVDDGANKYGHCLIIGRSGQIKNVSDRFNNRITDAQIAWFEANCPQWPVDRLHELIAGEWEIPDWCAFEIVWVDA